MLVLHFGYKLLGGLLYVFSHFSKRNGRFFFVFKFSRTRTEIYLKLQLLEEPLVLASLVPVSELDLGLLGLVFKNRISEDIFIATVLSMGKS